MPSAVTRLSSTTRTITFGAPDTPPPTHTDSEAQSPGATHRPAGCAGTIRVADPSPSFAPTHPVGVHHPFPGHLLPHLDAETHPILRRGGEDARRALR